MLHVDRRWNVAMLHVDHDAFDRVSTNPYRGLRSRRSVLERTLSPRVVDPVRGVHRSSSVVSAGHRTAVNKSIYASTHSRGAVAR